MKRKRTKNNAAEGCFDLIERAVHLLRQAPLSVLLFFYLGAIPFVLAVMFFLTDMSASPFAMKRCAGGAFGLAFLYIWMKVWHSVFCQRLLDLAAHRERGSITFRGILKSAFFHQTHSSWALLALPISAMLFFPYGWAVAYFQNLCIVDLNAEPMDQCLRKARKNSMPWPVQNGYVISILTLFSYLVFANVISVLIQLPNLIKSLGGMETQFTQSYHWIGNSTFLAAVGALTYLVVEPFIKSAYVLRFYACESRVSGEDILADLKQLPVRKRASAGIRIGLMVLFLFGAFSVKGVEPEITTSIQVEEFDATVDRVMQQREFTWRMPREFSENELDDTFTGRFWKSVGEWLDRTAEDIRENLERFFEWLGDRFTQSDKQSTKTSGYDPAFYKGISVFVLIILAVVLVIFLIKAIMTRRLPEEELVEVQSKPVEVDIEDENIIATVLKEDEWIAMARRLATDGEYRKAMRAWFLAGLSFLSRVDLVSIVQSKSNLEYRRELKRRAKRNPNVVPVFADNIHLFERAWYGEHVASEGDLELLEHNLDRMRSDYDA